MLYSCKMTKLTQRVMLSAKFNFFAMVRQYRNTGKWGIKIKYKVSRNGDSNFIFFVRSRQQKTQIKIKESKISNVINIVLIPSISKQKL